MRDSLLRVILTVLATAAIALAAAAPAMAATVIVDNAEAGFAVLSGSAWTTADAPGQWDDNYLGQSTNDPPGEVEWRPNLPAAGEYEVAVWIPATAANRPNNASYTINHTGGTSQLLLNQAEHEVQWVVLGTYDFAAGTTGRVTLSSSAQPDTCVVADAARFRSASSAAPEFRAFWASTGHEGLGSLAQIDDMVARAMRGNYNVINALIMYKQDTASPLSGALWNSSILPKATAYPGDTDPLAHLIQRAHANGLKVHGRLIPYLASTTWPPAGNTILSAHPEWLCVSSTNIGMGPGNPGGFFQLDPGSPDVQEYLISIVRELVTNYAIDGIHWDFIRHLDSDAGYPANRTYACSGLARFAAATGRADVPPPTGDPAWDDFRRRTIDELVRRSRAEIVAARSNPARPVSHTAAVAGWGAVPTNFATSSAYHLFQNWEMWMRLGWLDGACPMIYLKDHVTAEHDRYRGWVDAAIGWRYQRHMYIGQCLYLNTMANSIVQMQYAYDHDADGTINFAYGLTADNNLDGTHEVDWSWYPYVAANLFTEPAPTPAMPWRTPAAAEGTLWGRVTDGVTGDPVDNALVTVTGQTAVQTDANGYYVVTMIPATAAGTAYSVAFTHPGYLAVNGQAAVVAGDVARLDIAFPTPLPPVITDVLPDPGEILVGKSYFRQLALEQGAAPTWTLVAGPPGATITAAGLVHGWTANESQNGQLIAFTARAENSAGSDEESWQVLVSVPPPCVFFPLTDFEGYSNGIRVLFQYPRYSGSTVDDLQPEPNVAQTTADVAAFSGSGCYRVRWQFVDADPQRWLRLTTNAGPYLPNPTIALNRPVRVRLRVDAGRFRLALGVRETGTTAALGADGGTAGTIEWIGAATDINGAPQGVLVEPMPGVWQTFTFDPLTDPIHGMTGDGVLASLTDKGTLEHLAFAAVDTAGPFTVYIDDLDLLCDVPTPTDLLVESRDASGALTPPPAYLESGAWTNSTIKSAAAGLAGTGSRFITYDVPNAGADHAAFVPAITTPGRYELFATWANGANCYDARYTVRHAHGDTILLIDQIASGAPEPANYDQWISLGRFWLAEGQDAANAAVDVSEATVTGKPSPGWNFRVYADAVKLTLVEPWPDGDYTRDGRVNLADYAYWLDCQTGPGLTYGPPQCQSFDLDVDGDVDLADFAGFQQLFAESPP